MSAIPKPGLPAAAPAPRADEGDRAILHTVTYAGLFQFPLTLRQLHRGLMGAVLDLEPLRARLERPFLGARLAVTEGLVHLRGREAWIRLRRERERHTRALLERHRRLLARLAGFPFVRLVALSGACAHGNAGDDDVDVFLTVKPERAWAVTLALMLLSKWAGVRRTLCLNYIVDEQAATLPERDLFTASEIVGMRPLAGRDGYRRFVAANAWVAPLFPNFFAGYEAESAGLPEAGARRWVERLLELGPAQLLEAVSRRVLGAYLRRKTRGCPGVVLTSHRLKLHTQDRRPALNASFAAALREAGEERP